MPALIPGLTSGINGGKISMSQFLGFATYLPSYLPGILLKKKYVVQNVQTCSINSTQPQYTRAIEQSSNSSNRATRAIERAAVARRRTIRRGGRGGELHVH
jgi:hypothetical protein